MRTYGLIPAAGKSRRMGTPKLLLRVGERTVLEHVVAAVRAASVPQTLVVIGPGDDALAQIAAAAKLHVLRLDQDTPDMRATCERGLAWIEEHFHPRPLSDSWLLLPADHPIVRPELIRTMRVRAYLSTPTIIVPTHEGRRGHPTLLRWSHASGIRNWPPGQGLNAYIRAHEADTLELDWPTDEILRDLDTPEDYERFLKEAAS
jgi:molybdenum cofactor cytidylyltransferase